MASKLPVVEYLALEPSPHLVSRQCIACGADYFGRRNACAACSGIEFADRPVATSGEVSTFTIVTMAAPGIEVPFVAAVVDCDGVSVRTNLINVLPDPEHVTLGMPVRLATYSLGTNAHNVEAIGFGFEPREVAPCRN